MSCVNGLGYALQKHYSIKLIDTVFMITCVYIRPAPLSVQFSAIVTKSHCMGAELNFSVVTPSLSDDPVYMTKSITTHVHPFKIAQFGGCLIFK